MNKKQINNLLKEHNAVMVRNKGHQIWKFPNGKIVTISNTPSDRRVYKEIKKNILNATKIDNDK